MRKEKTQTRLAAEFLENEATVKQEKETSQFPVEVKVCNLRIIKIYYENKFSDDAVRSCYRI